ncbi:MAG: hypothetical protein Q9183_006163 [Haloplaca sp. 2 TL-2023]
MPQPIPNPLLPSAPASPPTPAPSPTPHQKPAVWHEPSEELEDPILRDARLVINNSNRPARESFLTSLVDQLDNQTLSFLHRLIISFFGDPKTFVRASSVSRRWRELLNDDQAWRILCEKHEYRRLSSDSSSWAGSTPTQAGVAQWPSFPRSASPARDLEHMRSIDEYTADTRTSTEPASTRKVKRPRPKSTHRSHFKHRYMVESAWRKGGRMKAKHITPDQGVVTSLHLTKKYIVVALDNAKIHIFDTQGEHLRTLQGHMMGVWAMVPWDDILGKRQTLTIWDDVLKDGNRASVHALQGHTSTVRCLKMANANTAISGSRDTTLRVWDLQTGTCKSVLIGHQASVRCLEIYGDMVVSGSYDTTAKLWCIETGQCLRTLQGHFSQIYAIAFDGKRVATGSLDTSVRIWNPYDG